MLKLGNSGLGDSALEPLQLAELISASTLGCESIGRLPCPSKPARGRSTSCRSGSLTAARLRLPVRLAAPARAVERGERPAREVPAGLPNGGAGQLIELPGFAGSGTSSVLERLGGDGF